MISAAGELLKDARICGFSAIARSVMISALSSFDQQDDTLLCFSAIARSVMISADLTYQQGLNRMVSVL